MRLLEMFKVPSFMLGLHCLVAAVHAQDRTVLFSTSEAGVARGVTDWGLDTAWYDENNIRRGAAFMGTSRVDVVRISFTPTSALIAGDLQATENTILTNRLDWVKKWAGPGTMVCINEDSPTVDVSFKQGNGYIDPVRWAQLIDVTARRAQESGRIVVGVAPFNEPDHYRAERLATMQTFFDTAGVLTNNPRFITNNIRISGGNTLNTGQANPWYNFLKSRLGEGNTHQLAGSFDDYAGFFQNVASRGDRPSNDELHNVMEAMVGAEYGMQTGIWWGTAEWARGEFVKASDGKRLGYAEHRPNWTAASVYRRSNGVVQAFVGESERQALPTSYGFFAKDRDVFYDGDGPRRDYLVMTTGGPGYQTAAHRNAERVVNITWGSDVPPLINGRYIIVNRNSTKVLEVPGASLNNGTVLNQASYTGALNQQWDVNPLPNTFGGDYSYFTIKAAHSGVTADILGGSYANGASIQQWNGGTNVFEQWVLDYTANGYFKIRTRWCNKVMAVNGASTSSGAAIVQWDDNGTLDHEWRFIPVGASPTDLTAPAIVTGLRATADSVSVQLTWNAGGGADLAGYVVLRGTTDGGPYDTVARGLTNNSFTDKSANQPKNYYYVVKAVDKSLNGSANSAQVRASPSGTAALVARYAFDGNASDSSGNANHPIVSAGSLAFGAGRYGSAMDLSGAGQYLMLPATLIAGVTNFTIALWVNWNGGSAWQRIFDFGNDATQYLFLTPSSGGGTLRFAISTNGYLAEQSLETSPLPIGQWRHLAITRQGSLGRLYINGLLSASNTLTLTPGSFNPVLNYLGKSQYDADPLFNGKLDDLCVFNYALSDTEIARLMNGQAPPPVAPTTLFSAFNGSVLNLSWPSNYLGARLESNSIGLAATDSWFPVSHPASTNSISLPVQSTESNVFFRLVYP